MIGFTFRHLSTSHAAFYLPFRTPDFYSALTLSNEISRLKTSENVAFEFNDRIELFATTLLATCAQRFFLAANVHALLAAESRVCFL